MNSTHNIEAHVPALRRRAVRLTGSPDRADDLVQETLLKALDRPDGVAAADNPRAYLMRMLKNQFIDGTRATRRAGAVPLDDMDFEAPGTDQADRMTAKQVLAALAALPRDFADVLSRHAERQQSYAQIARDLDIPIGTVMSRLSRARAALRLKLCGSATADCV